MKLMDEHGNGLPPTPPEDDLAREARSQKMPRRFSVPDGDDSYGPHSGSLRVEAITDPELVGDGSGEPVEKFMPKPIEGASKNVPLDHDPRD